LISENQSVILFDGVCNFCNYWVNFIIKHDKQAIFKFASLQSEAGKIMSLKYKIDPSKVDSVILIENNQAYIYSDAAIKIAYQLNSFKWIYFLGKMTPRIIRDFIYKFVAKNRYNWFGKKSSCMIPTPELKNRFLN
jgi:predicted DCC family thiol-disulfide oxidoreductase YuxK